MTSNTEKTTFNPATPEASDGDPNAAQARRVERAGHCVAHLSYLCLFILLAIFFYVLPEIPTLTHLDAAPRGSLDVPVVEGVALADVANGLWSHFVEIIHPLTNPLIRFFLVTSLVGVVLDQANRARQRYRECT